MYDEKALRIYASIDGLKQDIEDVCHIPQSDWYEELEQWKTPVQSDGSQYLIVESEVVGWNNG
jgi:hypothetical protein